ncbi:hypothetical protein [Halpernia sp. GG3]
MNAVTADGNNAAATGNLPANTKKLDKEYSTLTANTLMKSRIIGTTGGSQAHENKSPYLVLKNITAVQGGFHRDNNFTVPQYTKDIIHIFLDDVFLYNSDREIN